MKIKAVVILICCIVLSAVFFYSRRNEGQSARDFKVGDAIDSLNHVLVYYNGAVSHVAGRNTSADGYNVGLKYQCVEFVKRYYFEYLNHKMPDPWGHALDFFDPDLLDGTLNERRGLIQHRNPGSTKPREDDLLVMSGTLFNKYGHVAIVSLVRDNAVEIIQQNPGRGASSRVVYELRYDEGLWRIEHERIMGWLRLGE